MKKLLGRLLGKGVSAVRPTSTAILAAAGSSQRMGGENKLLLPLDGMPVLAHTLRAVDAAQSVDEIVIAAREEDLLTYAELCKTYGIRKPVKVVVGGATRQESVLRAALEALDNLDLEALNAQAQRANEETNRHYNPMFGWHGACAAPCGEKYLDEYQFIPLALSFSKDSPARLPMDCNIAILNPASENVGLANDFLEILIGQMDADVRAAFAPANAEPLLDQAVYDRQTSQQDEMIAQLETALGTAAESAKQELQEKAA